MCCGMILECGGVGESVTVIYADKSCDWWENTLNLAGMMLYFGAFPVIVEVETQLLWPPWDRREG